MSHVATIKVEVKDLDALDKACQEIGCELVRGQKNYRWYGSHVGDYPLPEGFTAQDLGKCDHAIRLKEQPKMPNGMAYRQQPYEIGVVKNKTGDGYTLLWDFWAGGYGLEQVVGKDAQRLRQEYATEVAYRAALRKGFRVTKTRKANGTIALTCTK